MLRAVYRVTVTGVRFESALHTKTKQLKDMPEPQVLIFKRAATDKQDAKDAVEDYLIGEDLIFEQIFVELDA